MQVTDLASSVRGLLAGLRSRRFSSNSDSGMKISTPTPTPTRLRLQPNNSYSILKGATRSSHFLDFRFDCIKMGDTAMQHLFAQTTDVARRGFCWFLWMWSVWQSLTLLSCHTVIAMALKVSPIPFIRRDSIAEWRFNFVCKPCFSPFLPLFQCFWEGA